MKSTRNVIAALAYPPTRSLPFAFMLIGSVWICASVWELYCNLPNAERRVGASTKPVEMTLKEFLNAGEANEYVKLTNFAWCRNHACRIPLKSSRTLYSIPIVPREEATVAEPTPSAVSLIVIISNENDDLSAIRKLTEVQGLIEDFQSLHYSDEEKIVAAYPNTDKKRCRVLRHGAWRVPITAEDIDMRRTKARMHLLISSICTATCLFLFIRLCRRNRGRPVSTAAP